MNDDRKSPAYCKKCGGKSLVYATKHSSKGRSQKVEQACVYRCRKCRSCGKLWTTVEVDTKDL